MLVLSKDEIVLKQNKPLNEKGKKLVSIQISGE
jgi:hypothetical protein